MDPNASPFHWQTMPLKPITAAFLVANCFMHALALAVVGLRFYSRITTSSMGWDDWWVLVAMILCTCSLITSICFDVLGSGYFVDEVMINLSSILLLVFIIQPLFLFTIAATKISVCCFYLRVFVGGGMRIATFMTITLVSAWAIAHFLAAVFICKPVASAYDLRLATVRECGDQSKFFQSGLSINVVLDAIVIALPLWTIWNLNMRRSDKVGLSIAFSIGLGMIVVGIIRAIYVVRTSLTGDVTATLPVNLFLTVFEQQLAVITISIPMLRPLWARIRHRGTDYSLERDIHAKGSGTTGSELATFGGTGGKQHSSKNKRRRYPDESILDTQLDGRDVETTVNVKGNTLDVDRHSVNSDWESHGETGSQTRLDVYVGTPAHAGSGAIKVTEKWKVSRMSAGRL